MKKISLAYFGSPDFAADFLEKLITDTSMYRYIEVKLVVTQPDQKVGRKQILTPTPVKKIALKFENLKIENSLKIESRLWREKISQTDLCLVYAYGDLIPKELLSLPKYGFWNIHPSLLPKYRGSSPIAAPLINGDKTTGVTIIKMDEEIDHGPIIAQESYTIKDTDYRPDLEKKLTDLGFEMFKKIIKKNFKLDQSDLLIQSDQLASYTKKLTKQDGFVSFENLKNILNNVTMKSTFAKATVDKQYNNETIYNLFRGLTPWPGLWTILPDKPHFAKASRGKRLKITKITMKQFNNLTIDFVQLEGKKEVDFETFNKAYKIF